MPDPTDVRVPSAGGRLRLAPRARLVPALHGSGAGASLWLVSGERVPLNDTAAHLLARCDGTSTAQQLAQSSPARDAALEFLAVALELRWVITIEGDPPDPA